jgi:hypothetical protein
VAVDRFDELRNRSRHAAASAHHSKVWGPTWLTSFQGLIVMQHGMNC